MKISLRKSKIKKVSDWILQTLPDPNSDGGFLLYLLSGSVLFLAGGYKLSIVYAGYIFDLIHGTHY